MALESPSSRSVTEPDASPAVGADNPNRDKSPNVLAFPSWPRLSGSATGQDFSAVVCAWCQRQILAGNPDLPISHGLCSPCGEKLRSAK